jgi:hypothetical protein
MKACTGFFISKAWRGVAMFLDYRQSSSPTEQKMHDSGRNKIGGDQKQQAISP